MKRRQRKKLHLKEFREFGIEFKIKFNDSNKMDNDKLMDEFIGLVEENNTFCGGGGDDKKWEMVVEVNKKYHTEDILTDMIKDFFDGRLKEGYEFTSKIVDLWN